MSVFIKTIKYLYTIIQKQKIKRQIKHLADNTLTVTPKQFFKIRNKTFGDKRRSYASHYNFTGVYILHNTCKNVYYVGQAVRVMNRVNNHFTGRGNGDVYADYKYGDKWTITMIALNNSPYNALNDLERYTIQAYNAYDKGYNKNRGNA